MVTFALGTTAPLGSVIVPVMPALACANPVRGANGMKHAIAIATHHPDILERRRNTPSFEAGNSFTLPPWYYPVLYRSQSFLKSINGECDEQTALRPLMLLLYGIDTIKNGSDSIRETIRPAKIHCQAIFWDLARAARCEQTSFRTIRHTGTL
jgi:hypothetical protein